MKRMFMVQILFPAMIAMFLATPSVAGVNLLTNPGFEDGGGSYSGWITFGAGIQLSTPADDNIIRTGQAAAKAFGEFTGCPDIPQFDVGGFLQTFDAPLIPGTVYELSGYSFVSSGDPIPGTNSCTGNRMIAKIAFFDAAAGGSEIQVNEIIIGDHNSILDQWNAFSVSAPCPTGALRVEALLLFLQPGCDTGAVYVDDLVFCQESPIPPGPNVLANPSLDSDLSGWTTFDNVFHDFRNFAVRTAPGSAKLFSSFVPNTPSGMFQSFAASGTQTWQFDLYAFTTCQEDAIVEANDNYMVARIVFRDDIGGEVGSTEEVLRDANSPQGTWTFHSFTGTAPIGTVAVEAFVLFISPTLMGGAAWVDDLSFRRLDPTSDAPGLSLDTGFELAPAVPNPFAANTRVEFTLDQAERVDLSVFDVSGRQVARLAEGWHAAGPHSVSWSGHDLTGAELPAGVYRYVLETSRGRVARSFTLLR